MSALGQITFVSPRRLAAGDARSRAVEAARARARAVGAPVLLRWLEPSTIADPWPFLRSRLRPGEPYWVARHGERGLSLAAAGAAVETTRDGPHRFMALATLCSSVLEQGYEVLAHEPPKVWPAAVGGFAFAAGPLKAPWQAWPAAWFFVPRALWLQEGDRTFVGVNLRVGPHTSDQALTWALGHQEVAGAPESGTPVDQGTPLEEESGFRGRVLDAVARLHGGMEKVVLARAERAQAPAGFAVEATWRAAAERERDALAFAFGHWGGEVFVGATPEMLVEVDGRQVHTTALAGTERRADDATLDRRRQRALAHSRKDGQEHAVVVESLQDELTAHCGEIHVARSRIRSTADLHHLECRIEGVQRQPGGLFAWAERLHPTPAVAGYPRHAALAHLEAHETMERGYYAGAVGYATAAGDGALWVAIRSALLQGGEATLYAGAGIVAASRAASEWRETEHKLAAMQRALRACPGMPA